MKSTLELIAKLHSKIAELEEMLEKDGRHFRCDCCEQMKPSKDFDAYSQICIECEERKAGYRNEEGIN